MRGSGRGGEGAILCQPSPRRRVECVCHSDCVSAEMQQGGEEFQELCRNLLLGTRHHPQSLVSFPPSPDVPALACQASWGKWDTAPWGFPWHQESARGRGL